MAAKVPLLLMVMSSALRSRSGSSLKVVGVGLLLCVPDPSPCTSAASLLQEAHAGRSRQHRCTDPLFMVYLYTLGELYLKITPFQELMSHVP